MPTRRSKAVGATAAETKKPASNKRSRTSVEQSENGAESENNASTTPSPDVNKAPKRAKTSQPTPKVDETKRAVAKTFPAADSQKDEKGQGMPNAALNNQNNDCSKHWDAQTLTTMNDRLRDELAQVRTELEHSQRLLQLNMGRAPILEDRACQSETITLIEHYDNIRKATQTQLSKMKPSHPKYWWWEYAHHLNTEMCRLVRESWTYRGFSV